MVPSYHFTMDEQTENVGKEGAIISNCAEIYFINRSSFDIYIDGKRLSTDQEFPVVPGNPLVIIKKRYLVSYKRTDNITKVPVHPVVKLEVRRVFYYLRPTPLTQDSYNL